MRGVIFHFVFASFGPDRPLKIGLIRCDKRKKALYASNPVASLFRVKHDNINTTTFTIHSFINAN